MVEVLGSSLGALPLSANHHLANVLIYLVGNGIAVFVAYQREHLKRKIFLTGCSPWFLHFFCTNPIIFDLFVPPERDLENKHEMLTVARNHSSTLLLSILPYKFLSTLSSKKDRRRRNSHIRCSSLLLSPSSIIL